MSKVFLDGIKTPFESLVKKIRVSTKEGAKEFPYLPWATALALADRPAQKIVPSADGLFHEVFGGGVVGISQMLGETEQVTWLPILNGANQAMPIARITSRDVSDTLNRCRAKAVAMVSGVSLSLYANGEANTVKFLNDLAITPESDLSRVDPVVCRSDKKNGAYVDWTHALAAVRISDPSFTWSVTSSSVVNTTTGEISTKPYVRLGTGWGVMVEVSYKGLTHTELLPIMGFREVSTKNGQKMLDHQPLENPNCHDWNRSVMRCLVKAIAVVTGYGLSVYAKGQLADLHVEPLQRKPVADAAEVASPESASPEKDDPARHADLVAKVRESLTKREREAGQLLAWLGYKDAKTIEEVSSDDLERGLLALNGQQPEAAASVH